jgi:hypothetical protein
MVQYQRPLVFERDLAKLLAIPTGPMTVEAINAVGPAFKEALVDTALEAELSHCHVLQGGVNDRFFQKRNTSFLAFLTNPVISRRCTEAR